MLSERTESEAWLEVAESNFSALDFKMMADSVALTANTVQYNDSTRTTSFYGTYYTFPATASPNRILSLFVFRIVSKL